MVRTPEKLEHAILSLEIPRLPCVLKKEGAPWAAGVVAPGAELVDVPHVVLIEPQARVVLVEGRAARPPPRR